ncbi:MAG: metallophosphoesterase family protein [Candidatus Woesearchaeota archaeon]
MERRKFLKTVGLGGFGLVLSGCAGSYMKLQNPLVGIGGQPLVSPIYQIGLHSGHNMVEAMLGYLTVSRRYGGKSSKIIFDKPVKTRKVSQRLLGEVTFHNILVGGLSPGRNYHYRLEDTGLEGIVKTAHKDKRPFKFLLESDTQCWLGRETHKPLRKAMESQMLEELDSRLLLNCGDVTQCDRIDSWINNFFPYYTKILPEMPFYSVRGNHDTLGLGFSYVFGKNVDIEGMPFKSKKLNYSFNYGDVHFIILNSNSTAKKTAREFLEDDINKSNAKFNLVFFHHPFEVDLEGMPVHAVFFGHSHRYARFSHKQTKVPYIIIGGGCDKMETKPYTGSSREEFELVASGIFNHYLSMHVEGNLIKGHVKDKTGMTRDRFNILPKAI